MRSKTIFMGLALMGALALAACGSDSDDSTGSGGTGGTTGSSGMSGQAGTAGAAGQGGSGGGAAGQSGGGGEAGSGGTAGAAGSGASCDPLDLAEEALSTGKQVLNGVTLTESTPIADILASPTDYEGQIVRVEGFVGEVCTTAGCWVSLQDDAGNKLNLKVDDGAVDFRDYTEVGQYGIGEGEYQQVGEHGAQVFIMDHGAMFGNITCPLP